MDFLEIAKPGHLGYSEDIIQESNTSLDDNEGHVFISEENDGYIVYSDKQDLDAKPKPVKKIKKDKRPSLKELFKLQLHVSGLSDHVEYIIMGKLAYPISGKPADLLLVRLETLLSQQKAKENLKKVQATKQKQIQSTGLRAW